MTTKPGRFALAAIVLGLGCGSAVACGGDTTEELGTDGGPDGSTPVDASMGTDSATVDTGADTSVDTGIDAGSVDRGPTKISIAGEPAGLYWDYGVGAALYIADSTNNKIVKWTDASGFTRSWDLPYPGDGGPSLGQVVRLLDGTMLVTNFGFGSAGTVFYVTPAGDAGSLGALAVSKRRLGLAILADGTLVDSYVQLVDGGQKGALAKLSLTVDGGKETDLATGMSQPAGVVYNERKLYVTDQNFGVVLKSGLDGGFYLAPDASVPDPDAGDGGDGAVDGGDGGDAGLPYVPLTVFATLASPELIAQGPDGTLFTGNAGGVVFQIDRTGVVTPIITGLLGVRGLAYDGAHKRLFVAERDPAGVAHSIRIYPIN